MVVTTKSLIKITATLKTLALLLIVIGLFSRCGSAKNKVTATPTPQFEHELLSKKNKTKPHPSSEKSEPDHETNDLPINTPALNFFISRKDELELFINDWHGVPHRMGGTSKKGVDCSGFVIVAYRDVLNLNFKSRRAQDLFSEMEPIDEEDLAYGDLVFFKIKGRRIDHVGIYLGNNKFAHASSNRGVMESSLEQEYFQKRFFKGGRYPLI
jgi:lipoprotein Spr